MCKIYKEPMITIPVKRWRDLCRAEKELLALDAGGVDNWMGYAQAMQNAEDYEEEENED